MLHNVEYLIPLVIPLMLFLYMSVHIGAEFKSQSANSTSERLFIRMHFHVGVEVGLLGEPFAAHAAGVCGADAVARVPMRQEFGFGGALPATVTTPPQAPIHTHAQLRGIFDGCSNITLIRIRRCFR